MSKLGRETVNILFCSNLDVFYKTINIKAPFYVIKSENRALIYPRIAAILELTRISNEVYLTIHDI